MKKQGTFIKNLKGNLSYKSFKPSNLTPISNINIDNDMVNLLSQI